MQVQWYPIKSNPPKSPKYQVTHTLIRVTNSKHVTVWNSAFRNSCRPYRQSGTSQEKTAVHTQRKTHRHDQITINKDHDIHYKELISFINKEECENKKKENEKNKKGKKKFKRKK